MARCSYPLSTSLMGALMAGRDFRNSVSFNGEERAAGKEDPRYKPYVLKRLTDLNPDEKTEVFSSTVSLSEVKEDIYENITMIFNSSSHPSLKELKSYGEVESSVLGYGVTDYCGSITSKADRDRLRFHIVKQLEDFEPRLDPSTVKVDLVNDGGNFTTNMEFNISGRVTVGELSEEILFVSKLNVETGKAEIQSLKN
jgi:type VI secretion system lysozyme-like protein